MYLLKLDIFSVELEVEGLVDALAAFVEDMVELFFSVEALSLDVVDAVVEDSEVVNLVDLSDDVSLEKLL